MENILAKKEIIDFLTQEKTFIKNKYGVITIGLFGSYARDEQKPDSDIDIIVEFEKARFDLLAGLQIFLEDKFGRKVEIVRKGKYLTARFLSIVEKDISYA